MKTQTIDFKKMFYYISKNLFQTIRKQPNFKICKRLEKTVHKKYAMSNKPMNRCLSLVFMEMKIKTIRYHYTSI